MKTRFFLPLFLACCLLAFAGCGKSPSVTSGTQGKSTGTQQTTKDKIDPCALITRAEAEAALGEPVGEPECDTAVSPTGQALCVYSSTTSERFVQISVTETGAMAETLRVQGESAATIYRTTRDNFEPVTEVPGIGDDAFWDVPGLHVLKGDVYLIIAVGNTDDPENLELAQSLAEIAVPRLP
jgi:hypothetical protein